MQQINPQPIGIPELKTNSPLLIVTPGTVAQHGQYGSYNAGGDMSLNLSVDMCVFLAKQIIREEMVKVRKSLPDAEIERIQTMIKSSDVEMNELGYRLIREFTVYTVDLLKAIRTNSSYQLQYLIQKYTGDTALDII